MKKFRYEVDGTDGAGQAFKVAGELEAGALPAATLEAQKQAYQGLTSGQTKYGQPGVAGCKGPYTLERILVEVVKG